MKMLVFVLKFKHTGQATHSVLKNDVRVTFGDFYVFVNDKIMW